MNEIANIITERVDDIPLLLEQMQRMGLPTLFDDHFPTHGNWTGLSLGWVSTIWLSSMLSRGDHRMVHVEPWVSQRLYTLGATTGSKWCCDGLVKIPAASSGAFRRKLSVMLGESVPQTP